MKKINVANKESTKNIVIIPGGFSMAREPLSFVLENRRDTKSKPSLTKGS